MFGVTYGHMGISITSPSAVDSRDSAKGDAYRYPNSGHCHGITPGASRANFSPGDAVTLKLSNGAAHDGGHCALFLASKNTQPTEQVWYKQMDEIDCTLKPSFVWTIDGSLVPPECTNGCTLIWVWTPKSSGACEIYMNCFDISILNPTNANTASTVQVTRPLTCSRVDNAKKTAAYGEFCGQTCATVQGGGTSPPTNSPGSTPPPTSPPAIPYRCGTTWVDANEKCSNPTCTSDADCTAGAPSCYADMIRVCTVATLAPTPPPVIGSTNSPTVGQVPNKCRAIGVWSGVSGIDQWCAENCATLCPASHCKCDSTTQALNPTTTTYQPKCEVVISKEGDTLSTITNAYDLSSQIAGGASVDEKQLMATDELYKYNVQCNPGLQNKNGNVWPELPVNTRVYLIGDCQLTNACVADPPNSAIRVSTDVLVSFIAIFGIVLVQL